MPDVAPVTDPNAPHEAGVTTRTQPPGTLRIGSFLGSDILVSRSWFFVALLIAYLTAPQAAAVQPGLGNWKYVAGLAFAVVLYGSVLLHELSHAVMARHFGFPVSSITLHFLGGMTAIEGEARRPREEFLIAVVGPLTSLAVAVVGIVTLRQLHEPSLIRMVISGVTYSNLIIGVLNLVPGLPLDGGRVLKALVWGGTGSLHRGTMIAGWCGRVLAGLFLLWPFLLQRLTGQAQTPVDYLMAVLIAGFLWSGATAAMSSARLRRRIPTIIARNLSRSVISVPEDTPLAEALRQAESARAASILTVSRSNSSGDPIGVVHDAAVDAVPQDRRPWVPVSSVARTIDSGMRLPAAIQGNDLILAMGRRPADEYLLVEDDGSILGVLTTTDVDKAFRESRH